MPGLFESVEAPKFGGCQCLPHAPERPICEKVSFFAGAAEGGVSVYPANDQWPILLIDDIPGPGILL